MRGKTPPAELPESAPSDAVNVGCLDESVVTELGQYFGLSNSDAEALTRQSSARECVAYATAMSVSDEPDATAVLLLAAPDTPVDVLLLRKDAPPANIRSTDLRCESSPGRVKATLLPAVAITELPAGLLARIPEQLRWELGVLTRSMTQDLVDHTAYRLRVVYEPAETAHVARLLAVELEEAVTRQTVTGSWWMPRADGLGAFVGARGVDYERLLWQSPVEYLRTSRGIKPTSTVVRRRVTTTGKDGKKTTTTKSVRVRALHIGVDMVAVRGTPVHAVADATVVVAGRKPGYGNLVILDHGHGYVTYYAHLQNIAPFVKAGSAVQRGENIGAVGSTGLSTGPHLHFEVRKDGKYLDPFDAGKQLDFWGLKNHEQAALLYRVLAMRDVRDEAPAFGCAAPASRLAIDRPLSLPSASDTSAH